MNIEEMKSSYDESFSELNQLISNSLGQVIQRELTIENEILQETNLKSMISADEYPRVIISFSSGSGPDAARNLFILTEDLVLKFYAWMIGDEPAEAITDDHYDGLTETVQQVFGQLKMAVADDQASFQLNDLKITPAKSAKDIINEVREEPGIACSFYLSIEESVYQVTHYFWGARPEEKSMESGAAKTGGNAGAVDIQPVEFGPLAMSGNGGQESQRNVEVLMDVELEVSVEIDRKMILISDLLKLGKGSIVELEKSAGEPLDIFVNGRKFAEGEVVVVDDRFGIRITQLLSPKERVKSLG